MTGMRVYKDADADLARITTKRVAIIGYGNQGHAHALNLRDSGVGDIVVGVRQGSANADAARAAGFPIMPIAEAARWADLVMILAPDEVQGDLYRDALADTLRPGATIAFAHGLNVQFGLIAPRADLDVILIAPKGPGHALRREYESGRGLLCLVAVAQDASGEAVPTALAYAAAIGGGRTGILQTTFKEECETDMFGEQAVLCGGLTNLVMAGFDTLVEAGYAPEMAYLECVHEVKLIADLMYERGIARMREAISNTAEFGDYRTGSRVIGAEVREEMRRVLADIQSGAFVNAFMADARSGQPEIKERREAQRARPIEDVGARLRALMQNKS